MKSMASTVQHILVLLLMLLLAPTAAAQTRAWLDRDRINANETVTLNIKTDGMARPDYDPLLRDFAISERSSRTEMDNTGVHSLFAVALRPRRAGSLVVPALRVGSARTQPVALQVDAVSAPAPSRAGDTVFLESEPDDPNPYVQQTVGWVVRLYSAAPLVSGELEQPPADGASMQQIGEDVRYSRDVAGRRYIVIERRYQLIPEHGGTVTVPGARFEGRGAGGFFDELFGDRGGALSAQAPTRVLQVHSMPVNAPQPWLPLRNLQLRYASAPRELRAGSAGTVVIEATADGATAAQMPELQLPPMDGVQAFPEPVQADETFRDGRPRVKLTRRFSLVPSREGTVTLSGLRIGWWDVASGTSRTASLPPLSWQVGAAAQGGSTTAAATPDSTIAPTGPVARLSAATGGANRGWVLATLLFAALWLVTLVWALHHRAHPPAATKSATPAPDPASAANPEALRRALATGDFAEVAQTLCALAQPPTQDVDALLTRIADPLQRAALEALQRARWGGGDGVAAREQLRRAFAHGPKWHAMDNPAPSPLPPLYPARKG